MDHTGVQTSLPIIFCKTYPYTGLISTFSSLNLLEHFSTFIYIYVTAQTCELALEPFSYNEEDGEKASQEETPQLMRTRSDVGVRRRGNLRTPGEQRRIKRHRFSINGHFYNHKTSVFTPAYGSVTNVRINSTMSTPQVLKLLLNKFKIENSAAEFSLYMEHTSGGEIWKIFGL
ncbi:ras association domain-containing protein 2-like [Mixophyes fleayi]|uniref:ras association domain-containing protein 2-like n=1 Tax=Mixophyes fleayi TaxID=3061075 RepID=UPI003F4DFCB5